MGVKATDLEVGTEYRFEYGENEGSMPEGAWYSAVVLDRKPLGNEFNRVKVRLTSSGTTNIIRKEFFPDLDLYRSITPVKSTVDQTLREFLRIDTEGLSTDELVGNVLALVRELRADHIRKDELIQRLREELETERAITATTAEPDETGGWRFDRRAQWVDFELRLSYDNGETKIARGTVHNRTLDMTYIAGAEQRFQLDADRVKSLRFSEIKP